MTRTRFAAIGLLLLCGTAVAKKQKTIDWNDPESVRDAAEDADIVATNGATRKTGLPHKVAIGGMQFQFTFQSQEFGYGDTTRVQFDTDDYVTLMDALYDVTAWRLEALGYEVVPKEQVLAAAHYAAVKGQEEAKVKRSKGIYTPTGFKRLPTIMAGASTEMANLAGLNEELGTDAVLFIQANFSVCELAGSRKSDSGGTRVCMGMPLSGRSRAEQAGSALGKVYSNYPALNVYIMQGAKGAKAPNGTMRYSPVATSNIIKQATSTPLVYSDEQIRERVEKTLFGGRYSADYDSFANGVLSLYDTALVLGFAALDGAQDKLRKKLE